MDSRIWSRMPRELLMIVIKYANRDYDFDTLDGRDETYKKWIDIVRGDRLLHPAVLAQQYRWAAIVWKDLILDPSETEELYTTNLDDQAKTKYRNMVDCLQPNSISGDILNKLLRIDHGLCPADVIGELNVNLNVKMAERSKYLCPSHATIRHTMRLILPRMRLLTKMCVLAATSNAIFEAMSDSIYSKLRIFRVGLGMYNQRFLSHTQNSSFDIYDWSRLTGITGLTELYIGELREEECQSLCEFIARQHSLEQMYLSPRRVELDEALEERMSPFQTLFEYNDLCDKLDGPCNVLAILPPSFKKLQIFDPFFLGTKRFTISPPTDTYTYNESLCRLSDLELAIQDLAAVRSLLQWLPNAELRFLAFSPVQPSVQPSVSIMNSDTVTDILDLTSDIISTNKAFLQEIVLTNAWNIDLTFADSFNRRWVDQYEIRNVTLYTDCPSDASCPEEHDEFHTQDLKHLLFGCSQEVNRWGSRLQRIRLELPSCGHEIDYGATDLLSYSSLQHLRILMIGPHDNCSVAWETSTTAFAKHQKFVDALLRNAPISLRYIEICRYCYWVDWELKTNKDKESHGTPAQDDWTRTAKIFDPFATSFSGEYARIQQEYETWRTDEDWEFIDNGSRWNKDRNGSSQRICQSELNQYWLQSFNFITAKHVT